MSRSLPNRVMHTVFAPINRRRQWHQLPFPISLLNLLSLRLDLREKEPLRLRQADPGARHRGAAARGPRRTPAPTVSGTIGRYDLALREPSLDPGRPLPYTLDPFETRFATQPRA